MDYSDSEIESAGDLSVDTKTDLSDLTSSEKLLFNWSQLDQDATTVSFLSKSILPEDSGGLWDELLWVADHKPHENH